jgi:hypothetical protein
MIADALKVAGYFDGAMLDEGRVAVLVEPVKVYGAA